MTIPNVFLDVETIPGETFYQKEVAEKIHPPGNISKPETIAQWILDKQPAAIQDAIHGTSLMPGYNRIVCISYAVDDGPVRTFMDNDEACLLLSFFLSLSDAMSEMQTANCARFVGHNIVGFDLPTIWWACIRNKVPYSFLPRPREVKPWDTMKVFDTLYQLEGTERKGYSLGNMARLFDLVDDCPGTDGSMVWDMWKAGEKRAIADYCANDVEITRQLFNRIREWAI
jgi:3'-5' exonuclease